MLALIAVGKLRNMAYEESCQEYLKRLSRYTRIAVVEIKDSIIEKEGKQMLEKSDGSYLVALSPMGKELSSVEFSQFLRNLQEKKIMFVIGSEEGLSQDVLQKANFVLSLSRMTLPHELCRVVFLEQLYRAFTIMKGEKYHK